VFAILGSGFGLYGYLPALAANGERVVLPQRYRDRYNSRPELARFASQIEWANSEAEALARADGVVLALRPSDQCAWIPRCLAHDRTARLILEKPLAPTPESALAVLNDLGRSGKAFRIGYSFRYTAWALKLRQLVAANKVAAFDIRWSFLAHHFRHDLRNWKRSTSQGGGAIRFYGIQVIALLAELGYREVVFSAGYGPGVEEIVRWAATFSGSGLPKCHVAVDTWAPSAEFRIGIDAGAGAVQTIVDQHDPFAYDDGGPSGPRLDRRVDVLSQLVGSWQAEANPYSWYVATSGLWHAVESKLQFSSTMPN
jgi:predicted dehydrogenase